MPRFVPYKTDFNPDELATLRRAYDEACKRLGIEPTPADPEDNKTVRDGLAAAVINVARLGERDPARLAAVAIAVGTTRWRLPKR